MRAPAAEGPSRVRGDDGITLVELMIYAALLGLVVTIVAGMMMTGIRVQSTVSSLTGASNSAQLVTQSLSAGISGASSFTITPYGSDQLVGARVVAVGSTGAIAASCKGWYYSSTYGELLFYSSASTAAAKPTIASTGTPSTAGWMVLATNVTPSGPTVFTAASSAVLSVTFAIATGGSSPLVENTSFTRPTQSDTTTAPTC